MRAASLVAQMVDGMVGLTAVLRDCHWAGHWVGRRGSLMAGQRDCLMVDLMVLQMVGLTAVLRDCHWAGHWVGLRGSLMAVKESWIRWPRLLRGGVWQ